MFSSYKIDFKHIYLKFEELKTRILSSNPNASLELIGSLTCWSLIHYKVDVQCSNFNVEEFETKKTLFQNTQVSVCLVENVEFILHQNQSNHVLEFKNWINSCSGLRDAFRLIRIWLHLRNMSEFSFFLSYLLGSNLKEKLEPMGLVRTMLFQLTQLNFSDEHKAEFLDSKKQNILSWASPHSLRLLQIEAQKALQNDDFLKEPILFDHIISFQVPNPPKFYKQGCLVLFLKYAMPRLFTKALKNRIKLVCHAPCPIKTNQTEYMQNPEEALRFGFLFNESYNDLVDLGPAPDTHPLEAKEFRKMWGSKSVLRRYKADGRILETVTWTEEKIPSFCFESVLNYLCLRHLGLDKIEHFGQRSLISKWLPYHSESLEQIQKELDLISKVLLQIHGSFFGLRVFCTKTTKVLQSTIMNMVQSQTLDIYDAELVCSYEVGGKYTLNDDIIMLICLFFARELKDSPMIESIQVHKSKVIEIKSVSGFKYGILTCTEEPEPTQVENFVSTQTYVYWLLRLWIERNMLGNHVSELMLQTASMETTFLDCQAAFLEALCKLSLLSTSDKKATKRLKWLAMQCLDYSKSASFFEMNQSDAFGATANLKDFHKIISVNMDSPEITRCFVDDLIKMDFCVFWSRTKTQGFISQIGLVANSEITDSKIMEIKVMGEGIIESIK